VFELQARKKTIRKLLACRVNRIFIHDRSTEDHLSCQWRDCQNMKMPKIETQTIRVIGQNASRIIAWVNLVTNQGRCSVELLFLSPLFRYNCERGYSDEYSSFWLADKKQLVRFSEDLDLHTKSEPGSRILFSLPF